MNMKNNINENELNRIIELHKRIDKVYYERRFRGPLPLPENLGQWIGCIILFIFYNLTDRFRK